MPVEICKPAPKGEAAVIVSFMLTIETKNELSVLVTSASFMQILKIVFASALNIDISMITKIQLVEWLKTPRAITHPPGGPWKLWGTLHTSPRGCIIFYSSSSPSSPSSSAFHECFSP